jgi:hypothetical protein
MRLRIAGFGRSEIPFDMFDVAREAAEAKRAVKLASLYHRAQDLAWDGREVLGALIAKHGGVHLPPDKRDALSRVFAIIMWGELAAWKISLQLADGLVPLEARMAATGQAHDEARHFYVMYDYLSELGPVPRRLDRPSRAVLDLVLNTDDLVKKLIGMQLMVETLALTIFQVVRESNCEPVLCELLKYYEKDEARHVGLGVQYLPEMLKNESPARAADLIFFQIKIVAWTLAGLRNLEPDIRRIGVDPRAVMFLGKSKQLMANEMLWKEMGIAKPPSREKIEAAIDAVSELMFPQQGRAIGWRKRWQAARAVWKAGGFAVAPANLIPPEIVELDTRSAV